MKQLLLIIILVAAGYGLWHVMDNEGPGQEENGRADTPVIVSNIGTQPLYDNVEALGTAYANESIEITANTTETISAIMFEDGQTVEKGRVIARLEQDEEQAQLKAAQAQLSEHSRELQRLENLLKNKAASKREYDERQTQKEITEQEIKEIKARIGERTLRAPFDGVLGLRRLSKGGLVRPGDVITTLDDISSIKLDFNVPDIYLSQMRAGMAIKARSASLNNRMFEGEVTTVNSRVDPVTRSVLVRAMIDNEDGRIKPGILMQVNLLEDQREAVVAPEEAIFQKQNKHFAMVVNMQDNTVAQREVEIGTRRPGMVEITNGLEAGEHIVVRGIHNVRDGQTVSVKETWDGMKRQGAQ